MSGDELFPDLPNQMKAREFDAGKPRLREPMRDQIELRAVDLEALVAADHPARVIWAYVEKLDLRELEQAIRARDRKSTRLNSSHSGESRMPSSA